MRVPTALNESSGPSEVDHKELESRTASPYKVGRNELTAPRCLSMEMYKIVNILIWDRGKSAKW